MARRSALKEEDIERALLEDDDLSDVGEDSEAVIEVDRVFDDLHDALTWEEEQHEVPQEETEATDDDPDDPTASLSPSEVRSRKRRRGPLQPNGEDLKQLPEKIYRGKDRTVWHSKPNPAMPKFSRSDDITAGAPTTTTLVAQTVAELFGLFMTDPLLAEVCVHTAEKIDALREKVKRRDNPTFKDVSLMELKALLGVLIMSGARKDNQLSTEEMFSPALGCPFYRSVMSERRFCFLLRSLRFDGRATREERRKADVFAPMREFWNAVIRQCSGNYSPGPHVTVDEQLLAFKGRCGFRMFIPNKPAK